MQQSVEKSLTELVELTGQQSAEVSAYQLLALVRAYAATTGLVPTIFVAASDASPNSILLAAPEYRCDGVDDHVQILAAITVVAALGGGKVELSEGTFTVAAAIAAVDNLTLQGQGFISTEIVCETNGIDVIQVHGADAANKIVGVTVRDLQMRSYTGALSDGLSLRYSNANNFENIKVYGFNGIGIHATASHDDKFRNIFVVECGNLGSTLPSVRLENLAAQDVNNENFLQLHLEQWEYRGLDIGPAVAGKIANFNRFTNCKFHGDETLNVPAIVCAGHRNIFTNVGIEKVGTGAGAIGVQLTGASLGNIFQGIQFGDDLLLLFEIAGLKNVIDGVWASANFANGFNVSGNAHTISNFQLHGASGYGMEIASNDNQIGPGYLAAITGIGILLSGNNNHLTSIPLSTVGQHGVHVTGHENELHGVSPLNCGVDAGHAMAVEGDENHIFGGDFNGPGGKTIDFAAGADDNRVVGAQVPLPITDAGARNVIIACQGHTPTGIAGDISAYNEATFKALLTQLAALGLLTDNTTT